MLNLLCSTVLLVTVLSRYNNYQLDPLSACKCNPPYSATNAIAARADLNLANGTYPFYLGRNCFGSIDSKVMC